MSGKKLTSTGHPHERRHPLAEGGVKITTFLPIRFKKRGVKKVIVSPDGVTNPISFNLRVPAITPTQDVSLLIALGRCYYWQHLLDTGAASDTVEIAKLEGLTKITVNETLRLAPLAPDIAEAILRGTIARTASRQLLLRNRVPRDWGEQREMIDGVG